eukprot:12006095-Alexandrium_andersonii.AAC.1
MDSGMDLLSDLLGPLEDPLQDDSLARSSEHDSSHVSVQRHNSIGHQPSAPGAVAGALPKACCTRAG